MSRANPFVLLPISIVFEVFGTTMMKLSEGFAVPAFTVLFFIGYLVAYTLLTFTLKKLPLGLVYGIWGGAGTVLTAAIGIIVWNDPFAWTTCVGIVLIIGGIVLLNQGTQDIERKRAQHAHEQG